MENVQEHLIQFREENEELRAELNRVNASNTKLMQALQEIHEIASISEGVEFYCMLAEQALKGEYIV